MNPLWAHSIGVLIVVMMLAFIGIWIWAWLPYHRRNFEALSRIPMQDDAVQLDSEDKTS